MCTCWYSETDKLSIFCKSYYYCAIFCLCICSKNITSTSQWIVNKHFACQGFPNSECYSHVFNCEVDGKKLLASVVVIQVRYIHVHFTISVRSLMQMQHFVCGIKLFRSVFWFYYVKTPSSKTTALERQWQRYMKIVVFCVLLNNLSIVLVLKLKVSMIEFHVNHFNLKTNPTSVLEIR